MLVGKESFCDFHTIQEAIAVLEQSPSNEMETLYILSGTYEEEVRIYRSYLHIIGIGQVDIRMHRYARERDEAGEEIGTFATPTLFLGGSHLMLENLMISNTAGQGKPLGRLLLYMLTVIKRFLETAPFAGIRIRYLLVPCLRHRKNG